ncbi:MAG: Gfo/Idh/MocA family oxidoreductase [Pseudomonadota bacterium]
MCAEPLRSERRTARPLRLALVGPGRWGRILVESVQGLSQQVHFTHAVARSPAKAADWCRAQDISLTADLQAVLDNPEVDAVVIATPHSQHADQIVAACQAGKHVFCDKPIALNVADADRAIRAVRQAGVAFAPGHNRRFLPAIGKMKALIDAGVLGTLLHAEGNMSSHVGFGEVYTAEMWRVAPGESPAGGLAAAGFHILDLMIHLVGPVVSVFAQTDRLVHTIEHDDTTHMLVRFDCRATGYVATLTATARAFRLQIFGEKGWLELRGETELTWQPVRGEAEHWRFPPVSMERLQLEAFADAIRTQTAFPVSMPEVMNGIAAFEAVSASANAARPLPVAVFEAQA